MATQLAHALSPAPLPFLLGKKASARPGVSFTQAVKAAVAAERQGRGLRKPCQRIALFLCELGKATGCRSELPLSRARIADLLGISLVRVKRTFGLLSLSGVAAADGASIRMLDWRKLSGLARIDPAVLNLLETDEDDCRSASDDHEIRFLTANGDPACFV
jgi:hypothetical protein